MAKPDHRVNKHGINVADLKLGQWVETEWLDAEKCLCLILDIEDRSASYKGERCMDVLMEDMHGEWRVGFATNTQVVRILGVLKRPR